MTLLVFPTLDGLELNLSKRPEFNTAVFESVSGYESRVQLRRYPKYTFTLNFEFLIENRDERQLSELMGFMLEHGGKYGAFLFTDPTDNAVTDCVIGTGDGNTTLFQLARPLRNFAEPVENVNGHPVLMLDGIEQVRAVDYSLSTTGRVEFLLAPPADGAVISWTGQFYYRVRFAEDSYNFDQLQSAEFYQCQSMSLIGSVRNIV